MKILITAFEPFGGEARNASAEILEALPGRIGPAEIRKLIVPTAFERCSPPAEREILSFSPDAVVCLGQAGGRDAITVERVAINVMDARIPDNDAFAPIDRPIDPDGPAAYFSTLPIRAMAAAVQAASVPARISDSAGTFVCNCLMYSLLRFTAERMPSVLCGFIHVPYLSGQAPEGLPALPFEDAVRGVAAAVEAVAAAPGQTESGTA